MKKIVTIVGAVMLMTAVAQASVIVGLGRLTTGADTTHGWGAMGLTPNPGTNLISSVLSVAAHDDVEAFTFKATLTSTTTETLAAGTFLQNEDGLFNVVGQGYIITISDISNENVQFDGFTSVYVGGNGGGDTFKIEDGANSMTSASTARIALDPALYGNGTSFTLATWGGGTQGVRMNNNLLQFSAIPEPATLGLIATFGGGLLFIRRVVRM